jgi:hypothetical protein
VSFEITLRMPHDVAREHLRVLEWLLGLSDVDTLVRAEYAVSELTADDQAQARLDTEESLRAVERLREDLHAALYCPVVR